MLAPGNRLKDRYRILEKIGGGGFGHVYKAIDETFGCCVAIKETKEEVANLDKLRRAFEREAKLLHSLKHECLPRVTDYFIDHGQFLVMDFIDGEDLAALLKKRLPVNGPFTWEEVEPWAEKILHALEYLHSRPKPIIHRDIKPSNLKLTNSGEIYLLDFGLAKGSAGQMSTVKDGESSFSLGAYTHNYAPLEQMQDSGTHPQSDIYAFGATLYHLLTGGVPVRASNRDEAIQRRQGDPLKPAHQVTNTIPHGISHILSRAMSIRWWDRFGSAKEMREALRSASHNDLMTKSRAGPESQELPAALSLNEPTGTVLVLQNKSDVSSVNKLPRTYSEAPLRSNLITGHWSKIAIGLLFTIGLALTLMFWVQFDKQPLEVQPRTGSTITPFRGPITLDGHNGIVWSVAFSPTARWAVSGGEDTTIRLWDTNPWQKFKALLKHTGPVYSVGFSPDGKILASASEDKTLNLWNGENGDFIRTIRPGPKPVLLTAFSPDKSAGNILVSVTGVRVLAGGEEIMLWYEREDWKGKTLLFSNVATRIYAVTFSPDGSTLAAGGYGKNIYLWDPTTGTRRRELFIDQPAGGFVSRLAFSADGKYLAAGGHDGSIKLWQTDNWDESPKELRKVHDKAILALAFSPENTTLISASHDDTMRAWDINSRTSDLILSSNKIRSVTFSPDGFFVLAGGDDQKLHVWRSGQWGALTSSNKRTYSNVETTRPQMALSHFFNAFAFGRWVPVNKGTGCTTGSSCQ